VIGDLLSASELQLYVFGGLRARLGTLSLDEVLSQKALALLCYLAVERREHSRSTLATLLWGEFAETDAATNLRQALSHLRRALDPYLVVSRHSVRLNPDSPLWLESEVFECHLSAAAREPEGKHLEAAINLYEGDFLQGFTLRDAPAFDEWTVLRRERFHAHALTALQTLADHSRARADYAASIAYTTRLLALDPWREEAHLQLMWLYVRTGQRSAALAQYQACRRILEQELGVEPMAQTTALYQRIKAAQATASPPIVLPATPFVGRTAERAELARRLAEPGLRLLTIAGPGGIGKTRLALQVASEWAARFLHGARFVDLASATTTDAFVSTLMSALDHGLRGSNDPRLQLRSYLAGKDLLLVLDNFEQLVDHGADVLVDILHHAPEVKLLVTSRERLQLRDEWLLELAGLDVPVGRSAEVENSSAVELFVESARKLRPDFVLPEADKPAVARICRLVEGTPLAIELAVAWTRVLSPEEIARELEQSLELLATSLRDLPARHRSLRAVFDHSWRLLAPDEQRTLRRLATFRGGFSRDAAQQVGQASPSLLATLLDKSLLYGRTGSAVPRYGMHEMVRHYARQKLDQAGELEEIQARHLHFFLQLAETARPRLVGSEQKLALDLLEREHDNFRAALQIALDRRLEEQGMRLAGALWRFWWMRGHLEEGCRWLRQVLRLREEATGQEYGCSEVAATSSPVPDPALAARAQALHGLGVLLLERGNFAEAQASHEQSLALRRAQGDLPGVSFSLNSLGVIAMDQGDYPRAQALYEESLALKRELGDTRGISGSLNNLGIAVSAQGDAARAQALYQESLDLCRTLDDPDGIAVALGNLALIALDQRDLQRAESLLKESLALFLELGDKDGVLECIEGLAGVATARGQLEQAVRLFGAAAAMRAALGTPWTPVEQARYGPMIAQTRSALEATAWTAAWAEGQAMTPEQSGAHALEAGVSSI